MAGKKKIQLEGSEDEAQDIIAVQKSAEVPRESVDSFWDDKRNDSAITDILREYGMTGVTITSETKKALMDIIKSRRKMPY